MKRGTREKGEGGNLASNWLTELVGTTGRVIVDPDADDGWRMPDALFWTVAQGMLSEAAERSGMDVPAAAWAKRVAEFAKSKGERVAGDPLDEFDEWSPFFDSVKEEALLPPTVNGGIRYILRQVIFRAARLEMEVGVGKPLTCPCAPEVSMYRVRMLEAMAGRPTGDEFIDRTWLPKAKEGPSSPDPYTKEFARLFREWTGEPLDCDGNPWMEPATLRTLFDLADRVAAGAATDGDRAFIGGVVGVVREEMEAEGAFEERPSFSENPDEAAAFFRGDVRDHRVTALSDWQERAEATAEGHRKRLHLAESQAGLAAGLLHVLETEGPLQEYEAALAKALDVIRWRP